MAFITTKIDLQAYRDRIERQKAVLRFAIFLSDSEKEDVERCYDELIAICDERLLQPIELKNVKVIVECLDFEDETTQNPAQ